jgi:hypothetical protein
MTGRCWRLLAIFSLIFTLSAPALSAQRTAEDRFASSPAQAVDVLPLPDSNLPPSNREVIAPAWSHRPLPPRVAPPVPASPGSQQRIFQQLVRSAGMIFSGRVISVETGSPLRSGHSTTAVTFQVEHAILGVSARKTLTIHEWAGLWDRGERYRVGERVFLFLYAPSKFGFTSPVGGNLGKFAVKSGDQILLSEVYSALWNGSGVGAKNLLPYSDFATAVQRAMPGKIIQP